MPFQDDSGIHAEEQRGPLVSTFATLWDQIERMVPLNIAWAIHLLPALGALAYPELPLGGRAILLGYSALVIAPATGALFGALWRACDQELLSLDLVKQTLRQVAYPSFVTLGPLYSLLAFLSLLALWAARQNWLLLDTLARLLFLLLGVCAMYWGPLFAENPAQSPLAILRQSIRWVWRRPFPSLLLSGAVLLTLVIGVFSVGGLFLIAPVLIALLQIQHYRHFANRRSPAVG